MLVVVDGRSRSTQTIADSLQTADNKRLIVANKADLPAGVARAPDAVAVSATTGAGLDELAARESSRRSTSICCAIARRSRTCVTSRSSSGRTTRLARARAAALADGGSLPEEFVLADLQEARAALEEITGRRAPDDVLAHIFSRFCVGK